MHYCVYTVHINVCRHLKKRELTELLRAFSLVSKLSNRPTHSLTGVEIARLLRIAALAEDI